MVINHWKTLFVWIYYGCLSVKPKHVMVTRRRRDFPFTIDDGLLFVRSETSSNPDISPDGSAGFDPEFVRLPETRPRVLANLPTTPDIYVTFLDPLKYGLPVAPSDYPGDLVLPRYPDWYLSAQQPWAYRYYNVIDGQKHFVISVLNS